MLRNPTICDNNSICIDLIIYGYVHHNRSSFFRQYDDFWSTLYSQLHRSTYCVCSLILFIVEIKQELNTRIFIRTQRPIIWLKWKDRARGRSTAYLARYTVAIHVSILKLLQWPLSLSYLWIRTCNESILNAQRLARELSCPLRKLSFTWLKTNRFYEWMLHLY